MLCSSIRILWSMRLHREYIVQLFSLHVNMQEKCCVPSMRPGQKEREREQKKENSESVGIRAQMLKMVGNGNNNSEQCPSYVLHHLDINEQREILREKLGNANPDGRRWSNGNFPFVSFFCLFYSSLLRNAQYIFVNIHIFTIQYKKNVVRCMNFLSFTIRFRSHSRYTVDELCRYNFIY